MKATRNKDILIMCVVRFVHEEGSSHAVSRPRKPREREKARDSGQDDSRAMPTLGGIGIRR